MVDLTKIYHNNLCQEIVLVNPAALKYKFSRNWYKGEFDSDQYSEVEEWCEKQFGPHAKNPDAWSRWWLKYENVVLIRDERDYVLFVMTWGV